MTSLEICSLSLQHRETGNQIDPSALSALTEDLTYNEENKDCEGILWISSQQNAEKIFIIRSRFSPLTFQETANTDSAWKKGTYMERLSESLRLLRLHTIATKTIYLYLSALSDFEFPTATTLGSFNIWYYPEATTSNDKKKQIHDLVTQYFNQIKDDPARSPLPRSTISSWGVESTETMSQKTLPYMLCAFGPDQESMAEFQHAMDWRHVCEQMKALGSISEEEHSGIFRKPNERQSKCTIKGNDDEDLDEEEIEFDLKDLSQSVGRLIKVSEDISRMIGTTTHHDCADFEVPESDGSTRSRRLNRIR